MHHFGTFGTCIGIVDTKALDIRGFQVIDTIRLPMMSWGIPPYYCLTVISFSSDTKIYLFNYFATVSLNGLFSTYIPYTQYFSIGQSVSSLVSLGFKIEY